MLRTYLATAAFGLEGVAANELKRMGIAAKAENGGARFEAEEADAFRANLMLRTADRVLLVLAEKEAQTFEELYQLVSTIPWESLLQRNASIHVTGKCVRSQLMSIRDCQSVSKKAIVNRLMQKWRVNRLPESGEEAPVDIAVVNNLVRVTLDMSGEALNRRGYRTWNGEAPLRETLAAALVDISPWRKQMPLYDACCGTGTLLIEAALKASGTPVGIHRKFACEHYPFMPLQNLDEIRRQVQSAAEPFPFRISGSDIDSKALELCRKHISQAGLEGQISVRQQDLRTLNVPGDPGVFLMNPPYGERLGDQKSCRLLYKDMGAMLKRHPGWKLAAITADPAFERWFGRWADKKRRLYNGRLECDFYIFE